MFIKSVKLSKVHVANNNCYMDIQFLVMFIIHEEQTIAFPFPTHADNINATFPNK